MAETTKQSSSVSSSKSAYNLSLPDSGAANNALRVIQEQGKQTQALANQFAQQGAEERRLEELLLGNQVQGLVLANGSVVTEEAQRVAMLANLESDANKARFRTAVFGDNDEYILSVVAEARQADATATAAAKRYSDNQSKTLVDNPFGWLGSALTESSDRNLAAVTSSEATRKAGVATTAINTVTNFAAAREASKETMTRASIDDQLTALKQQIDNQHTSAQITMIAKGRKELTERMEIASRVSGNAAQAYQVWNSDQHLKMQREEFKLRQNQMAAEEKNSMLIRDMIANGLYSDAGGDYNKQEAEARRQKFLSAHKTPADMKALLTSMQSGIAGTEPLKAAWSVGMQLVSGVQPQYGEGPADSLRRIQTGEVKVPPDELPLIRSMQAAYDPRTIGATGKALAELNAKSQDDMQSRLLTHTSKLDSPDNPMVPPNVVTLLKANPVLMDSYSRNPVLSAYVSSEQARAEADPEPHRFADRLYAVGVQLVKEKKATPQQVVAAIKDHANHAVAYQYKTGGAARLGLKLPDQVGVPIKTQSVFGLDQGRADNLMNVNSKNFDAEIIRSLRLEASTTRMLHQRGD